MRRVHQVEHAVTGGHHRHRPTGSGSNGNQKPVLDQTLALAGSVLIGNLTVKDSPDEAVAALRWPGTAMKLNGDAPHLSASPFTARFAKLS
jgi:hypothetical protein